jgi:hypothetical protein
LVYCTKKNLATLEQNAANKYTYILMSCGSFCKFKMVGKRRKKMEWGYVIMSNDELPNADTSKNTENAKCILKLLTALGRG